jgi:hypothetical protein
MIKKDHLGYTYIQIFKIKFYWPLVWLKTYQNSLGYGENYACKYWKQAALNYEAQADTDRKIRKILQPINEASNKLNADIKLLKINR